MGKFVDYMKFEGTAASMKKIREWLEKIGLDRTSECSYNHKTDEVHYWRFPVDGKRIITPGDVFVVNNGEVKVIGGRRFNQEYQ